MTTIRSASSSASSRYWVVSSRVTPAPALHGGAGRSGARSSPGSAGRSGPRRRWRPEPSRRCCAVRRPPRGRRRARRPGPSRRRAGTAWSGCAGRWSCRRPLRILCRLTRGNRQPCHPVGDRRVATARLAGQKLTEGQPGRGIARVRHRGLPGLHWMHERDACGGAPPGAPRSVLAVGRAPVTSGTAGVSSRSGVICAATRMADGLTEVRLCRVSPLILCLAAVGGAREGRRVNPAVRGGFGWLEG